MPRAAVDPARAAATKSLRQEAGRWLKAGREAAGLTQAELAEQVGVSRKTVNTVENGVFVPSTPLALGLARALGVRRPVGSPTVTLINEYKGKKPLAHIDLYRIRGAGDAFGLGLDDYLCHYPGIVAIEWAERVAELLPEECWHVKLEAGADEESRTVTVDRPAD